MMRVTTRKSKYSDEKVIEFSSDWGERAGGLVSFTEHDDGTVTVELYRMDKGVKVVLPADWPGWNG